MPGLGRVRADDAVMRRLPGDSESGENPIMPNNGIKGDGKKPPRLMPSVSGHNICTHHSYKINHNHKKGQENETQEYLYRSLSHHQFDCFYDEHGLSICRGILSLPCRSQWDGMVRNTNWTSIGLDELNSIGRAGLASVFFCTWIFDILLLPYPK